MFENLIKSKTEDIILGNNFQLDYKNLYWNIIFYIQLLDLPSYFLDDILDFNIELYEQEKENLNPTYDSELI